MAWAEHWRSSKKQATETKMEARDLRRLIDSHNKEEDLNLHPADDPRRKKREWLMGKLDSLRDTIQEVEGSTQTLMQACSLRPEGAHQRGGAHQRDGIT